MKDEAVCTLCGSASPDALVVLRQPICGRCEDAITHLDPDYPDYVHWLRAMRKLWGNWIGKL